MTLAKPDEPVDAVCVIKPTEFRFNAGCLTLDVPATVRRRAPEPEDALAGPGAPARWFRDAGLSEGLVPLSDAEEQDLFTLREEIWAVADAARADRPLPFAPVEVINKGAAHHLAVPHLDASIGLARIIADDPFRTALAMIARDAIELFSGPLRSQIKACAQDDCHMVFLDSSRSSRRRWFSMDRCGSWAKGAIFRQRHKGKGHEQ